MAPLFIYGNEWSFVAAFIIGLAFGFILENAGFSSSRKLVGVFYGYDFVVLRVFFTAALTAIIGLLFFNYLGWIDLQKIWVNPLYVTPTLVGGAIMGLGFIMGGFCPGTSITAVSIGKIDAMFFVLGIFLGVFIFGETYPLFEGLHNSGYKGPVKVYESLGMSRELFVFLLIVAALAVFYATAAIQRRVSKSSKKYS